jgi:polysaccharide pyruvyl transferase WcaK-like protein
LRTLCAEIATTDAVVATRYHTIIGALLCGRPAVSIGYAGKNKAVMEMFGAGAYCQSIGDYEIDVLQRQFADATANSADTHRKLRTIARRLRQEVQDHFARIAGEVASRREQAA